MLLFRGPLPRDSLYHLLPLTAGSPLKEKGVPRDPGAEGVGMPAMNLCNYFDLG